VPGSAYISLNGGDIQRGVVDALNSGSGMGWFFANLAQDLIHGQHDAEIVENLG
jgi:hypothetical protein